LLYIIDSMLIVNPDQRVKIIDVVNYCQQQMQIKFKDPNHLRAPSQIKGDAVRHLVEEEKAQEGIQKANNGGVDPCLVMDDIIEKLTLLEYNSLFCKKRSLKPVSRTFFAFKEERAEATEKKVEYMFDLCYWLMSLGFHDIHR
jgi:hypothetical protein